MREARADVADEVRRRTLSPVRGIRLVTSAATVVAVVGVPGVGPAGALEEVTLGIIGQCLAVDEGVLVQRVGSVVSRRAVVHLLREVAERIVLVADDPTAAVGDAGHLVGGVVGVEIVHGGIEVIERFGTVADVIKAHSNCWR